MPSNKFGEIIRDGGLKKQELSEEEKETLRKMEDETRALHDRQSAEEVEAGAPISDNAASVRREEIRKRLLEGGGV
ncbi:MAG: hypothetical protein Q7S84_03935 [bacterium]|nr:hypothetical protein [bacterium]